MARKALHIDLTPVRGDVSLTRRIYLEEIPIQICKRFCHLLQEAYPDGSAVLFEESVVRTPLDLGAQ